jgi:uncharacterized protein (TIGR02588 family)
MLIMSTFVVEPPAPVSQDQREDTDSQEGNGHSFAEWVTLAISSLLVLGLVALTSYLFMTASSDPAAVTVQPNLNEVYQAGARFYLPITALNPGGETATDVRVRVTLTDAASRVETSEFQIQFLAGGASSRGVASFGSDPRQGQLEAAVVSFLEP